MSAATGGPGPPGNTVELSEEEVTECLKEAGIGGDLKPPYSNCAVSDVQTKLMQLTRENKHTDLLNAVIKCVRSRAGKPQAPNPEEMIPERIAAYKIVFKLLGVNVDDEVVKVCIKDQRVEILSKTERGWRSRHFIEFLKNEAPKLISSNAQRTGSSTQASPLDSAAAQRRGSPSRSATPQISDGLSSVIDTIRYRVQPELERVEASGDLPRAYLDDVKLACRELRIPEPQEVRNVIIGDNGMGKSTAIDASLQATEVTAVEYASNMANLDMNSRRLLKPEWDVLSLHIGKEASLLLSDEEVVSEREKAMGCGVDDLPSTWRLSLSMPDADEVKRECATTKDRLSEYVSNPSTLFGPAGSDSYLLPVGKTHGVTTGTTMEFKYNEQFARLQRFPDEEDMQQRAYQYVTGLLELKDAREGIAGGGDSVGKDSVKQLEENLPRWRADYCAVVRVHRNVVEPDWPLLSSHDIDSLLGEIAQDLDRVDLHTCFYQDIPVCEAAKRLANHRYDIRYTGGEHGRDGDRIALKKELKFLNEGNVSGEEQHDSDASPGSDADGGESMETQEAQTICVSDDFRKSQLCDLCIVYGPWNVLKGGHVFIDTCGLGDSDPEHRRQQEIVLGPVDQGGAEVVTALVERDLASSAALQDVLTRFNIVQDALEGRKLLVVGRLGERKDAPKTKWYMTSQGIKKHGREFSKESRVKMMKMMKVIGGGQLNPVPPLNLAWVLFFSALRDPTWQPTTDGPPERDAVLNATYMQEYLGVLEYWRLKKTEKEVWDCHEKFSDACRRLESMRRLDTLTKKELQVLPLQLDEHADDSYQTGQFESGRKVIENMVNLVMRNGVDAHRNELRLKEESVHSEACVQLLLQKQANGHGLRPQSKRAALTGGRFTLTEHRQGTTPHKSTMSLADFLFKHEDGNAVGKIALEIREVMGNIVDSAIAREREHCKTTLVDRMTRRLSAMDPGKSGEAVREEEKQLRRLADLYLEKKDKVLYNAKSYAKSQLAKNKMDFSAIGKEAYKKFMRDADWKRQPTPHKMNDEFVRARVNVVVLSSRAIWLTDVTRMLTELWSETDRQLRFSAQKLIQDFGPWTKRSNVRGDLMPSGLVSRVIGDLKNVVSKARDDLYGVANTIREAVSETDIGSTTSLARRSEPTFKELVRASKLAACLGTDSNKLLLPDKAGTDISQLYSLKRKISLRSTVNVRAYDDPTAQERIAEAYDELRLADTKFCKNHRRTEDFDTNFHPLAEGLYEACYKERTVDGDGANQLSESLEQCKQLWVNHLNQARLAGTSHV